jgi:hypothetical protein
MTRYNTELVKANIGANEELEKQFILLASMTGLDFDFILDKQRELAEIYSQQNQALGGGVTGGGDAGGAGGESPRVRFMMSQLEQIKALSAQEIDIEDNKNKVIIEKRNEFVGLMEQLADAEREISEQRLDLAQTFVGGFANLLAADYENRKKYSGLIKALGIAEVMINLYRELSAIALAAAQNPYNAVTMGAAGTAQFNMQSAMAIARAAFATGQILATKYAKGGYTQGEGMYIAGEAGKEYIAPNWQVEHPVYGPLINQLNAARTGQPVQNISNVTNNFGMDGGKIDILISQIAQMNRYLKDPKNRRAYFSRDDLTRYDDELSLLRELAEI